MSIPIDFEMEDSVHVLVTKLTKLIYDHGDERSKVVVSAHCCIIACVLRILLHCSGGVSMVLFSWCLLCAGSCEHMLDLHAVHPQ